MDAFKNQRDESHRYTAENAAQKAQEIAQNVRQAAPGTSDVGRSIAG